MCEKGERKRHSVCVIDTRESEQERKRERERES
jgi:hypothetical protein